MIRTEQATVYRGEGCHRRWFTREAAIKDYTAVKFKSKHGPCECEQPDYGSGYQGCECEMHRAWARVMPRYRRFVQRLMRGAR